MLAWATDFGQWRHRRSAALVGATVLLACSAVLGAESVPGTLPGVVRVDQTGAAIYAIPLDLPPGVAGLEPDLALAYHSRTGSGLAGFGWSLNGLSAISRCARTKPVDGAWGVIGYDAQDRFCLDGRRMVAIAGAYGADGTEYRLEIDDFTKIVSRGAAGSGPAWFEAWTRTGARMQFGNTEDSRIQSAPGVADVRVWALDRVSDTAGNYMVVTYDEDTGNGMAVPLQIDYTGNSRADVSPTTRVSFHYEPRETVRRSFEGGKSWAASRLLSRIEAAVGGTVSHVYRLERERSIATTRSLVKRIERCDGAGNCMPATRIAWSTESLSPGWTDSPKRNLPIPLASRSEADRGVRILDLDGDGRMDLIQRHTSSGKTVSNAYLNTGAGWRAAPKFKPPVDIAQGGRTDHATRLVDLDADGLTDIVRGRTYYTVHPTKQSCSTQEMSSDMGTRKITRCYYETNGDGVHDYQKVTTWTDYSSPATTCVQYNRSGSGWSFAGSCTSIPGSYKRKHTDRRAYRNTGTGWASFPSHAPPLALSHALYGDMGVRFLDFDGDSRQDLVYRHPNGGAGAYRNTVTGWAWTSRYAAPARFATPTSSDLGARPVDLNGDGLTDLLFARHKGGSKTARYAYLNTGSGWKSAPGYIPPVPFVSASGEDRGARLVDLNGDGLIDLMHARKHGAGNVTAGAYLNTGKGWRNAGAAYRPPAPLAQEGLDDLGVRLVDLNADGLTDLVQHRRKGSGNVVAFAALNTGSGWADAPGSYIPEFPTAIDGTKDSGFRIIDLDGDGVPDHAYHRIGNGGAEKGAWLNRGVPELVTGVVNGLGADTAIQYRALTEGSWYTTDRDTPAAATYPRLDVAPSLQAVETTARSGGVNGSHEKRYYYGAAKWDPSRRDFLGFRWMNVRDMFTGVLTTTEYGQDFPIVGRPLYSRRYLNDGKADTQISTIENTWGWSYLNDGMTVFPHLTLQETRTYEPSDGPNNGHFVRELVSTTYDSMGNALSETEEVTSGESIHTRTVMNTYANDETRWILGLLLRTQETRTRPGAQPQTRTNAFSYAAGTGLLVEQRREPGTGATAPDPTLSLTTTYTQDLFGNRTSETATASGHTRSTQSAHDPTGRFPASSTNALDHEHRWRYDDRFGKPVEAIDPNNLATAWVFDGFGREILVTHPDGTTTSTAHHFCDGACPDGTAYTVVQTTTGMPTTRAHVDPYGRTLREERTGFDGTPIYVDYRYDAIGQLTERSRPYFSHGAPAAWATMRYDATGRLVSETSPVGLQTTHEYFGLVSRQVQSDTLDPTWPARAKERESDALGGLTRVTDALGGSNSYEYDAFGNLTRIVDARGRETVSLFDALGRMLERRDPDLGTSCFTYDAFGQLITKTDANTLASPPGTDACTEFSGTPTVRLQYDPLGRLIARQEPEGLTTWTYDTNPDGTAAPGAAVGRLRHVAGHHGTTELLTVDDYGRVIAHDRTIAGEPFTTGQEYDAAGRLARVVYPVTGYTIEYAYSPSGHLEEVRRADTDGEVLWRAGARDADGHATEVFLGNGLSTMRGYEAASGLIQHIQTGPAYAAATAQNLAYAFGPTGSLLAREDYLLDRLESFTYDRLGRLTASTLSGGRDPRSGELGTTTFEYDAVGNLARKSDVGLYRYDAPQAHALTSTERESGELQTYTYDGNGNMLTGNRRWMTWTSYDKPRRIRGIVSRSTFAYGADRARVQQIKADGARSTTTKYVGAHFEKVSARRGRAAYRHHVFAGNDRVALHTIFADRSPAQTRYLHTDHLGSIDTVTNEQGDVVERLSYDAYGKRRELDWTPALTTLVATEGTRGYTQHEHLDGLGLIHMNGRVFDPELGRFLSPDPITLHMESTQGLNRYSYVRNDPLSRTDPSGFTELFGGYDTPFGKPEGKHAEATVSDWARGGADLSGYDDVAVTDAQANNFLSIESHSARGRSHELAQTLDDFANSHSSNSQSYRGVLASAVKNNFVGFIQSFDRRTHFDGTRGTVHLELRTPNGTFKDAWRMKGQSAELNTRIVAATLAAIGFALAIHTGLPVLSVVMAFDLVRQSYWAALRQDPVASIFEAAGASKKTADRIGHFADYATVVFSGVGSVPALASSALSRLTPHIAVSARASLPGMVGSTAFGIGATMYSAVGAYDRNHGEER